MSWPLKPVWQGEDVYVLGGGPSVRSFPLSRLTRPVKVVGCNDAYLFGEDVVDVLTFGDLKWYNHHKQKPAFFAFQNPKITNHPRLKDEQGIIWAPREQHGFHLSALGWNGNTGSMAINIALLLGAARVLLVGFDMALGPDGKGHWHKHELDSPQEHHYTRYKEEIERTASDISKKWPGVTIINLNPLSTMSTFPKMAWEEAVGGVI